MVTSPGIEPESVFYIFCKDSIYYRLTIYKTTIYVIRVFNRSIFFGVILGYKQQKN